MTIINHVCELMRSLFADECGISSIRFAVIIGLSASAVLMLVRVGTAVAAVQ
jgi:Flp pilus assembly pilin Flp